MRETMQLLHVWIIDHADTKTNSEMYALPNCVMLPLVFDDIKHPLPKNPTFIVVFLHRQHFEKYM